MTGAAGSAGQVSSATWHSVARAHPPAHGRPSAHGQRAVATDARRWLQLGLAVIWLFAGVLQAQAFMFTDAFAKTVLAPAAAGNPEWIAASIRWSAGLVMAQPVAWNTAFAVIQVALGLGIAFRPTLKVALAASAGWALIVWWFGEGLGGLLSGSATAFGGAPGAVLLYGLLAVLLWPPSAASRGPVRFVAERPIGAAGAKAVWVVLWGGFAFLNLQPANLAPDAVHDMVAGMGDGQPGWISAALNGFAQLSRGNGTWLSLLGAVVLAAVAIGVLLPLGWRRPVVIAAIVVSVFSWVFGQALGAVFGGQATDPNSGPLLILIALAYWPLAERHPAIDEIADPAVDGGTTR